MSENINIGKDFEFKKSLGQNFLFDKNLLNAIAEDAGVTNKSRVLEIGAGSGNLTDVLDEKAEKVVSIETDARLFGLLREKFKDSKKTTFVFADILKVPLANIEKDLGANYEVVANLPYYITTPVIFKFFEEKSSVARLTFMVQKEVAERIVATPGSKTYGILSVLCQFKASCRIMRTVSRKNFRPQPKVDSAILRMDLFEEKVNKHINQIEFFRFVRTAFSMRRKTLVNNLKSAYTKESIEQALITQGKTPDARAEALSVEEFKQLFQLLFK